jgi:Ca2+-binding RTX toxin-like protein
VINGGAGHDWLVGGAGAGNDWLVGSQGADIFVFDAYSGYDEIVDFNADEGDMLDLSAFNQGDDTVVQLGDDSEVYLLGVDASGLTMDLYY